MKESTIYSILLNSASVYLLHFYSPYAFSDYLLLFSLMYLYLELLKLKDFFVYLNKTFSMDNHIQYNTFSSCITIIFLTLTLYIIWIREMSRYTVSILCILFVSNFTYDTVFNVSKYYFENSIIWIVLSLFSYILYNRIFEYFIPTNISVTVSISISDTSKSVRSILLLCVFVLYNIAVYIYYNREKRIALLLAINYKDSNKKDKEKSIELDGCAKDVVQSLHFIKKIDYEYRNMYILTDEHEDATINSYALSGCKKSMPTLKNIEYYLEWIPQNVPYFSFVFFHYSGHGLLVKDTSGDEPDGFDEALYSCDQQVITDDTLYELFVSPLLLKHCRCLAIIDACHSGSAFDLPFSYNFDTESWDPVASNYGQKLNKVRLSQGYVLLLSGCQDNQTSGDTVKGGVFTNSFYSILNDMNCNDMTVKQVLDKSMELVERKNKGQKPNLSSSKKVDLNAVTFRELLY